MKTSMKLNTMAGGAVQEHFNRELEKVLENIQDINTDPKKKRKITLTLDMTSDDNRELIAVDVGAKSTLVPVDATPFNLVTGKNDRGNVEVKELYSGAKGQSFIDDEGEAKNDDGSELEGPQEDQNVRKLFK